MKNHINKIFGAAVLAGLSLGSPGTANADPSRYVDLTLDQAKHIQFAIEDKCGPTMNAVPTQGYIFVADAWSNAVTLGSHGQSTVVIAPAERVKDQEWNRIGRESCDLLEHKVHPSARQKGLKLW